jgi:hypothetical protein
VSDGTGWARAGDCFDATLTGIERTFLGDSRVPLLKQPDAPSLMAKVDQWQPKKYRVLNHRPGDLTAEVPVWLLSTGLATFVREFSKTAFGVQEDVNDAAAFERNISKLQTSACLLYATEKERMDNIEQILGDLLEHRLCEVNVGLGRRCDLGYTFEERLDSRMVSFAPLLLEAKNELGQGSCDVYLQVTGSFMNFAAQLAQRSGEVLLRSSLPTLLVYMAGPFIGVAGGVVLVDKGDSTQRGYYVVDPLTPLIPLFTQQHDMAASWVWCGDLVRR